MTRIPKEPKHEQLIVLYFKPCRMFLTLDWTRNIRLETQTNVISRLLKHHCRNNATRALALTGIVPFEGMTRTGLRFVHHIEVLLRDCVVRLLGSVGTERLELCRLPWDHCLLVLMRGLCSILRLPLDESHDTLHVGGLRKVQVQVLYDMVDVELLVSCAQSSTRMSTHPGDLLQLRFDSPSDLIHRQQSLAVFACPRGERVRHDDAHLDKTKVDECHDKLHGDDRPAEIRVLLQRQEEKECPYGHLEVERVRCGAQRGRCSVQGRCGVLQIGYGL